VISRSSRARAPRVTVSTRKRGARRPVSGRHAWRPGAVPAHPAPHRSLLTARSVATFYTLLAQRRLADTASSTAIETLLAKGCAIDGALFDAIPAGVRARKCGTASGFVHDSALIEHDKVRYVMVYLTKNLPMSKILRTQLIKDLDGLIVANNP